MSHIDAVRIMTGMANKPRPRKQLGKRLVAIRAKLGLTQAEAAAKICVSRESWQSWETGRRTPNGSALKLLQMLEAGQL